MASRMVVVALVFLAAVTVAVEQPAESPDAGSVIGGITGAAIDAAPVGGPVPNGVFPNLSPLTDSRKSGAAAVRCSVVVIGAGLLGAHLIFL